MKLARRIKRIFIYFFLSVMVILSAFPLLFMIVSATNKSVDILGGSLLPGHNLFANFQTLIAMIPLGKGMLNSFVIAFIIMFGNLVICSAAGYAFEIYRDNVKDKLMGLLLLSMMVPIAATIVPLFTMFSKAGLIDNIWGVILPALSTALMIFLFRQNAKSFPKAIIDASRIDGLSEFRIFVFMFVPIMRPAYAAAAIISFMTAWNNYLWPLVVIQSNELKTMPLLTSYLLSGYVIDYGALMLCVSIATIPMIVIFFLMQKSFIEGILGSYK